MYKWYLNKICRRTCGFCNVNIINKTGRNNNTISLLPYFKIKKDIEKEYQQMKKKIEKVWQKIKFNSKRKSVNNVTNTLSINLITKKTINITKTTNSFSTLKNKTISTTIPIIATTLKTTNVSILPLINKERAIKSTILTTLSLPRAIKTTTKSVLSPSNLLKETIASLVNLIPNFTNLRLNSSRNTTFQNTTASLVILPKKSAVITISLPLNLVLVYFYFFYLKNYKLLIVLFFTSFIIHIVNVF